MDIVLQSRINGGKLEFGSGMELIWRLEDAFEQKDMGKFLSLVSFDFKKGFIKLKEQLEREFRENIKLDLYMFLHSKSLDASSDICSYDICWSKRSTKSGGDCYQRKFGKATIVFKRCGTFEEKKIMLSDILGDNPFVS